MKLERLRSGQIVYDVGTTRMGNTTIRTVSVWHVRIESVDLQTRSVIASWNSNAMKRYSEREVNRWRLKKPVLVKSGLAYRLARRDEIAKETHT